MKLFLVIFIIIPTLCFASSKQIVEADKLYNQFFYKAAASLYQKAIENHPSYILYLKLSDAYFFDALNSPKSEKKELLFKSKAAVEEAQKLKTKDAEVLARMSRIYGQLALLAGGKEKIYLGNQVKKYATEALALNPDQPTANAVLGVWYYELASLDPIEKAFANLIYGKLPKGNYNRSLSHLEKAVQLDPNVIFFRLSLAKTLLKLKKKDEALVQINKALSLSNSVASDKLYKIELKKLLSTLR